MLDDGDFAGGENCHLLLEGLPPQSDAGASTPGARRRRGWRGAVGVATTVVGAWLAVWALASPTAPVTWTAPGILAPSTLPLLPTTMTGYSLNSVSCAPSGSLCVAVDDRGNAVATATPAGDTSGWNPATIDSTTYNGSNPPGARGISCPSASLCVAVNYAGNVITSTHPAGGTGAWSAESIGANVLLGVSCPTPSLCVAVDATGFAFTSSMPTDARSWKPARIDAVNSPQGVSCPSAALCAAVDDAGNAVISTDPAGGASTWSATAIDTHGLNAISCPSVSLCVAVDGAGSVVVSTDPTGGAAVWHVVNVDGPTSLNAISCPSASLCVAVDDAGRAVTSTNPGAGAGGAWQPATIDGARQVTGVSCGSTSLCVAVDRQGFALVGTSIDTTQTLTVSLAGSGSGTVAGTGIGCPPNCSAKYPRGTIVALTAEPAAGSIFTGWGGACSGIGGCRATLSSAQAVTATFTARVPTHVLDVSVGGLGDGMVAGSGISCPPTCSAAYPVGTTVSLTATAQAGSLFAGWNEACSRAKGCSVTLSSDQAVQATFNRPVAPRATILAPKVSARPRRVLLQFRGMGTFSGFQCALVYRGRTTKKGSSAPPGSSFRTCHSSKSYAGLRAGRYAFYVRAVGPGGIGHPAQRTFTVR